METILRKVSVNCEVLEKNDEFVILKLYYTDEEALDFIKRYIPSIEILDEKLNKKLRDLLQNFLIRNWFSDLYSIILEEIYCNDIILKVDKRRKDGCQ